MRPHDWFKLACRVLGLWQLLDAAGYTLSIFNIAAGFARVPADYSLLSYLVQLIGTFFFGVVLLIGAPVIADLFYPSSPRDKQMKEEAHGSHRPST
jgi:hypothetical protein